MQRPSSADGENPTVARQLEEGMLIPDRVAVGCIKEVGLHPFIIRFYSPEILSDFRL